MEQVRGKDEEEEVYAQKEKLDGVGEPPVIAHGERPNKSPHHEREGERLAKMVWPGGHG